MYFFINSFPIPFPSFPPNLDLICSFLHIPHPFYFAIQLSFHSPSSFLLYIKVVCISHSTCCCRTAKKNNTLDNMSDSCASYNEVLILWFQAGQKLENGKTLAPCPRCSLPSQIDGVSNVGQCTHKTCQYLFCCICHCESHNGSSCPYLMPFSQFKKRSSSMCSKESKKNLRRL